MVRGPFQFPGPSISIKDLEPVRQSITDQAESGSLDVFEATEKKIGIGSFALATKKIIIYGTFSAISLSS
jgi:hypothetical protein